MAASAGEESTVALPEDEKEHRRGHIGLVVLGSIGEGEPFEVGAPGIEPGTSRV